MGLEGIYQGEDINELKGIYKILFESGKPLVDNARELLEKYKSKRVKILLEFIISSKRGIPFIRKNING